MLKTVPIEGFSFISSQDPSEWKGVAINLGPLLRLENFQALILTPVKEQDRARLAELSVRGQEVTGGIVEIDFVDQG